MGANFFVACHKCKEKAFAFREFKDCGETLTKFFHKHLHCGIENIKNVEVYWDYFGPKPIWAEEAGENSHGYKDISGEVCEAYKKIEDKDLKDKL